MVQISVIFLLLYDHPLNVRQDMRAVLLGGVGVMRVAMHSPGVAPRGAGPRWLHVYSPVGVL